jgi:hypothetical protein
VHTKKAPKLCWNEVKALQIETKHHMQEIQGFRPHVSARPSDQSTQLGHLTHLDPVITAEVQNYNPIKCRLSGKICFSCVGTMRGMSFLQ